MEIEGRMEWLLLFVDKEFSHEVKISKITATTERDWTKKWRVEVILKWGKKSFNLEFYEVDLYFVRYFFKKVYEEIDEKINKKLEKVKSRNEN